jgi:hypothetical protein
VTNDVSALVTVLAVVGLLGLLMRWIFKPSRPRGTRPLVDAGDSSELGLLDVVAVGLARPAALSARAALGDAGIRSSMSRRRNGSVDVLVFHDDAERARQLLS